jgi:hypothetical protein
MWRAESRAERRSGAADAAAAAAKEDAPAVVVAGSSPPPSLSARVRARGPAPWLKAVRANPSELVAQPVLLGAALMAAGFAATGIAAAGAAVAERRSLQAVANGAVAALEFVIHDALSPLRELRDVLENDSALAVHSAARAFFVNLAPGLVASNKAIVNLQLWPYGRLAAAAPLSGGDAASGTHYNLTAALGAADLLGDATTRPAAVLAVSARDFVLLGPLTDVFSCGGAGVAGAATCSPAPALIAHVPVFVLTASAADPWADSAWPGAGAGSTVGPFAAATDCAGLNNNASGGVSLCATNALGDGRRLWGFVCECCPAPTRQASLRASITRPHRTLRLHTVTRMATANPHPPRSRRCLVAEDPGSCARDRARRGARPDLDRQPDGGCV